MDPTDYDLDDPAPDPPPEAERVRRPPSPGLTRGRSRRGGARPAWATTSTCARGASYGRIVRENVFNFINNLFFTLGVLLVALGRPLDAFVSVA